MGVFGTKSTPAKSSYSKPAAKPVEKAAEKKKPQYLLKVKEVNAQKSTMLTGLFLDDKFASKNGQKYSGKDREGNRFIIFINEDNSGSLSVIPAGEKEAVRLTALFFNEGKEYGPYHSGKDKEGNKFYVSAYRERTE